MFNRENVLKIAIVALFLIIVPMMAFSSRKKDIYVDAKASGSQTGSMRHPYKDINQALSKASGNTDIHVAKGEYKENITLKKGVRLFGEDKEKTIIKAKKDKWSTVFMEENSEINGFTIQDGKNGIWIDKYAKAKVIDCIVKYNDENGIRIEGKYVKSADQVLISKTEIRKNGRDGIYLDAPRKLTIIDSNISSNKSDGIDLAAEVSAWIADNRISDNGGSGMKLVVDRSDIWTSDNSIRRNKREGIEVSFFGGVGKIDLAKSKIVDNGRYGLARVQRAGNVDYAKFNQYLTFGNKVEFWGDNFGNVSRYIFVR